MKTTKSGRTFCKIFSLTLLTLCIALTSIACGENFMVTDFLGGKKSDSKPLPELTVTAPAFADVYPAYTQPAALSIVITNIGNSSATIPSGGVTVPAGSDFTIVGTGSSVVGANSSIANWTVRPKSGLAVGTHTAEITVTYDNNAAATATVTFTVMQPGAVTRNLTVTAPAFADVYTGYTQPVAQNIIITNTGNSSATIPSGGVTVSGSDFTIATIVTGDIIVGANSSIANWTVRPKAGLSAITHTATITVKYDNNAQEPAEVKFVVMARERFVAVSYSSTSSTAAYSANGINWTAATMPSNGWNSVTYGNGKYVAVGMDKAAYSFDGINWTETTIPRSSTSYKTWYSVTYGNGKFVAVDPNSASVACSADGRTWKVTELTGRDWLSATYGNGKFVAVAWGNNGNKAAAYSNDGSTWTTVTNKMPTNGNYFVTYGNSKFVAVGRDYVVSSTNGSDWSSSTWSSLGVSSGNWYSVTYGGGKFVAVNNDDNKCIYGDGTTWAELAMPSGQWYSVTYGKDKFVAVAPQSTKAAYWSGSGAWKDADMPVSSNWCSVTYGIVEL